jgi:two-component system chemotaxis response regulator CheB
MLESGSVTQEEGMDAVPRQLRVLIVSASPYTRYVVSGELSSARDVFVVGSARSVGEIAQKQAMLRPDAAVVDLESYRDVVELRHTLSRAPLPVLVLSSHSHEGAGLAFAAIEAGAVDFVARSNGGVGEVYFAPNLLSKVRGLAQVRPSADHFRWANLEPQPQAAPTPFLDQDRVIVVSGSTGSLGPLIQLLAGLPPSLNASLLVLSPLPACYVRSFVTLVNPLSGFTLAQARDGLPLNRGVAFVAPSGHPLLVQEKGILKNEWGTFGTDPASAVDVTLTAAATKFGPAGIAVILSGLGSDGVQGVIDLHAAGGSVIVQEVDTCLADETPRAVVASGVVTNVLQVDCMPAAITRWGA